MRCRVNVFNCRPEKGAGFVATEPLSSNGRSIIRLLGATSQYVRMDGWMDESFFHLYSVFKGLTTIVSALLF
jgi:hypothetical protein